MTELGSSVFALRGGYCILRKSWTHDCAGGSWRSASDFFFLSHNFVGSEWSRRKELVARSGRLPKIADLPSTEGNTARAAAKGAWGFHSLVGCTM